MSDSVPAPRMGFVRRRFPFLFWPLFAYRDVVDLTEPSGQLREHANRARYSLRLQRYWWAASKINEEAAATDAPFVVVDLGCERGWLKRFTRPNPRIRWVGLDGNTTHPSLAASHYDEVIACNFQERLPLPDACADAVVSLHVFEHLHDADFTASEVQRILKPGGVFLAGTPGAPGPLAAVRTRILRRRDRVGQNRHWGHVQKFSPASWARLCESAGLGLEFLTGSHLIRKTGARLENKWWWVRLNQVWGALFPSLGQEIYLSARKPAAAAAAPAPGVLARVWFKADWAAPIAAVLAIAGLVAFAPRWMPAESLADEIALHQDGNDDFVWGIASRPASRATRAAVMAVGYDGQLDSEFEDFAARGRDLHLIIDDRRAADYLGSPVGDTIHVTAEWRDRGHRVLVLTTEQEGPALRDYLEISRN